MLAVRLLRKFGNQSFPGVSSEKFRVEYYGAGDAPEGKTWEQHMQEGTLLVGIGGGPFDEHPTAAGEERKRRESACSLMAKHLGMEKHPVYKRLVDLVTDADQAGVDELHIANRIKTRYRLYPDDPRKAMILAWDILDDWEAEQRLFISAQRHLDSLAGGEAHRHATGPEGKIDVVFAESDNFKLSAAARSRKIAVLVQRHSEGNVQIFSSVHTLSFDMKFVVAELRRLEMAARGMTKAAIKKIDPDYLCREGKITEVPQWYYQVPGQNILNGSEAAPDTEATEIPPCKILEAVTKNVFANRLSLV